jgi:AcrR family transcriptional regulator
VRYPERTPWPRADAEQDARSSSLTRTDVVEAAAALFALRGPDGVSLREIAERLGIRKASLLHHFESKEALYSAVVEEAVLSLAGLIFAAKLDEGPFPERLDRLGALVCAALAARPHTARLLLYELVGAGPYIAAGGEQRVQDTLELTAAFLEAGIEAGAFRRQDPRQLALSIAGLHLFAFAAGRASSTLLGGDLFSPKQVAARTAAVLAQVRALCLDATPAPKRPPGRAPPR